MFYQWILNNKERGFLNKVLFGEKMPMKDGANTTLCQVLGLPNLSDSSKTTRSAVSCEISFPKRDCVTPIQLSLWDATGVLSLV